MIKVFISYSHDNDAHRQRVHALADRLRNDGADIILDRDCGPGGPGVARPGQSGRGIEGVPGGHGHQAATDRTRPEQYRLASGLIDVALFNCVDTGNTRPITGSPD